VAYSPLMGFGAALAQLVRPSSVLVVRIIESASSRARRVYRRPFEGRILDVIERFVLRRAALVIPMAGFTRGIARTAGVPDDRIIELIYETRWSGTGIRETSDPASPPRVVYAGRLVPEKGVDLLTLAFADIAAEIPDVVLEVAGDGPERVALERLALHLGVAPRVTFHGWLPPDRMPDFLAGAMVAVLPSRVEEGFGMALIEAGLAGCALVGTDLGGTRDIVHHGRTGLLVAPNDALGIADAVIHLLSRPDEARRLGAQARIRSLEFLDARRRSLRLVQQRLESLRLDRERGLAPPGQAI
jgi:glycosyltransferase involved in cell wall biosynthesis